MKHSGPRGTKKKGKRKEKRENASGGGFRKSILSHMVCLCCELILLVFRKFNYAQDKTRLDVCVCAREHAPEFLGNGRRLCARAERSSLSIRSADTRQSSVQNGSQNVGSMRAIKELGGSVLQPPRDLLSP